MYKHIQYGFLTYADQNISLWLDIPQYLAALKLYVSFSIKVSLFSRVRYKKVQEIKGMPFICSYICEIICGVIAMSAHHSFSLGY